MKKLPKKQRKVATWRQIKKNGFYESGIIYNNKKLICDELYFKWVIDGKIKWSYEMTTAEAMLMVRGFASAIYYKLAKEEAKKFGKLLNKNNPL